MTKQAELINAVQTMLGSATLVLRRKTVDALYTAYVFTLVLRAIQHLGVPVRFRSIQCTTSPPTPPPTFVFRGAPGSLASQAADYGYAEFTHHHIDYEVHVSVECHGFSDMKHELDVSILTTDEAQRCRDQSSAHKQVYPRARGIQAGVECKYYGSSLPKELIRAFSGLMDDFTKRPGWLASNLPASAEVTKYVTRKPSGRPQVADELEPDGTGTLTAVEQDFINAVAAALQKRLP